MAMTPEERIEFNQMKATLQNLQRVEDVAFVENIKRRLDIAGDINTAVGNTTLNDLADVDTTGVSNGQVIKYNNGTWENDSDNTA